MLFTLTLKYQRVGLEEKILPSVSHIGNVNGSLEYSQKIAYARDKYRQVKSTMAS